MSLYKQFKADGNLERDGILLQYGENSAGQPICIRIARAGGANTEFTKAMEAATKPYRRQIQTETMPLVQVQKLMHKVYAQSVVIGWENVEDEEGKPMQFSVDNCIKLFQDLPDLFLDLQEQAQRAVLFRAEIRDADAGN